MSIKFSSQAIYFAVPFKEKLNAIALIIPV